MSIVTYNISASFTGSGYNNIDTFLLFTNECGVPGEEYSIIQKTDLANGFSIGISSSVETIYLIPYTNDDKPFYCRLGCNTPSASLTLSGFIETPAPTIAPTIAPTTAPIVVPTTPGPTTPAPATSYTYQSFGSMTLNKTSITSVEFLIYNPSSYARTTAASNLAFFFADQYVAQSTDVNIRANTHVFTSEQSSLLPPECSYQYLDVNAYTQIGTSAVRWFDQPAQEYAVVRVSNLNTLPSNLQSRIDSFLFLYTTDNICT